MVLKLRLIKKSNTIKWSYKISFYCPLSDIKVIDYKKYCQPVNLILIWKVDDIKRNRNLFIL